MPVSSPSRYFKKSKQKFNKFTGMTAAACLSLSVCLSLTLSFKEMETNYNAESSQGREED